MNSHFFLDAGANNVIGIPQAAVLIDPYFRDQKNRNALGTRRVPLNPRQYGVNDIFGEIVLTVV